MHNMPNLCKIDSFYNIWTGLENIQEKSLTILSYEENFDYITGKKVLKNKIGANPS